MRRIHSIQLNIAIQTDCVVILSCIVQFRERVRARRVIKKNLQNFENKLSRCHKQSTHVTSIMRFCSRFQRQASITSSSRLFIVTTTNQKRQDDKKSLRRLSKHSCEMNFSYITFKLSSNSFRTTISIVLFSLSRSEIRIKNINIELIERRFQQKHNKMFLSRNYITISIITRDRISYECNAIQNQKDDRKFTCDKTNRKSIKIQLYR